jgi:hypothetical protein
MNIGNKIYRGISIIKYPELSYQLLSSRVYSFWVRIVPIVGIYISDDCLRFWYQRQVFWGEAPSYTLSLTWNLCLQQLEWRGILRHSLKKRIIIEYKSLYAVFIL